MRARLRLLFRLGLILMAMAIVAAGYRLLATVYLSDQQSLLVAVQAAAISSLEPVLAGTPTLDLAAAPTPTLTPHLLAYASRTGETGMPTPTLHPLGMLTPSLAQDMTATLVADCVMGIELVHRLPYSNPNVTSVVAGQRFPMTWVLSNSGTCVIKAGSLWSYREGEPFGAVGPVLLSEDLDPGDSVALTTNLRAPSQAGPYVSIWQLEDPSGEPLDGVASFTLSVLPATAAPAPGTTRPSPPPPTFRPSRTRDPSATPTSTRSGTPTTEAVTASPTDTPSRSPTSEAMAAPLNFDVGVDATSCKHIERGWTCLLTVIPFGGIAPYRLHLAIADSPERSEGPGPFTVPMVAADCDNWIRDLILIDGSDQLVSRVVIYDPDELLTGGCARLEATPQPPATAETSPGLALGSVAVETTGPTVALAPLTAAPATPTSAPTATARPIGSLDTPIPGAATTRELPQFVEAEWPGRMQLEETSYVRVALVRRETAQLAVTVQLPDRTVQVATPLAIAGTPAAVAAQAFGSNYRACAAAELITLAEAIAISQADHDCQSLQLPELVWEWAVQPLKPGDHVLLASVDVIWSPRAGQVGEVIEQRIWRERLTVRVVRPLLSTGQLNLATLFSGAAGLVFVAPWVFVRRRDSRTKRQLIDGLATSRILMKEQAGYFRALYDSMVDRFDREELKTLCFTLGVDYDSLRAEGKAGKVRELILAMVRNGRLDTLTRTLRQERPLDDWPAEPPGLVDDDR